MVRRSDEPVAGADLVVSPDHLVEALADALVVVLAAPLTEATRGLIGPDELAMMSSDAWLINVSRGALVDTGALVEALETGSIAGLTVVETDVRPGNAVMYYPEANALVPRRADPSSRTPAFKCVPVEISPDG